MRLASFEEGEDGLKFHVLVNGDDVSHEDAGQLSDCEQTVVDVRQQQVAGHQDTHDVLTAALVDRDSGEAILVDDSL